MKRLLLIFIVLFSICSQSRAQSPFDSTFILEPYVGFEKGFLTQKGIPEITVQGLNYGVRLGYILSGVGIGFDYMTSSQTTQQSGQKGDFKPTDYGIFLGHKFESGIKIYGSYFISDKAKIQSDDNTQDFSGSGYKLGLGWALFSYCDVALEVISRKYTKYDSNAMTNSILGSTAGLSIAIPLL